MKLQGRFRHLSPDIVDKIQTTVIEKYHRLKAKAITTSEVVKWAG
jgi:hypothetical protein